MNCVSYQPAKPASGPSQVVVPLSASETALPKGPARNLVVGERALQEDMNRRAEVITDVLAGIMEHPAAYRHWGLNE